MMFTKARTPQQGQSGRPSCYRKRIFYPPYCRVVRQEKKNEKKVYLSRGGVGSVRGRRRIFSGLAGRRLGRPVRLQGFHREQIHLVHKMQT